jgi:hypothetical protein
LTHNVSAIGGVYRADQRNVLLLYILWLKFD